MQERQQVLSVLVQMMAGGKLPDFMVELISSVKWLCSNFTQEIDLSFKSCTLAFRKSFPECLLSTRLCLRPGDMGGEAA